MLQETPLTLSEQGIADQQGITDNMPLARVFV
jgi:hypothetical protein